MLFAFCSQKNRPKKLDLTRSSSCGGVVSVMSARLSQLAAWTWLTGRRRRFHRAGTSQYWTSPPLGHRRRFRDRVAAAGGADGTEIQLDGTAAGGAAQVFGPLLSSTTFRHGGGDGRGHRAGRRRHVAHPAGRAGAGELRHPDPHDHTRWGAAQHAAAAVHLGGIRRRGAVRARRARAREPHRALRRALHGGPRTAPAPRIQAQGDGHELHVGRAHDLFLPVRQ
jgi:hypothetical protein